MDFSYMVKQLDHEIEHDEIRLREKKNARDKLWATLDHQQQTLFNPPASAVKPSPAHEGHGDRKKAEGIHHRGTEAGRGRGRG
jgi:hypothetical protein